MAKKHLKQYLRKETNNDFIIEILKFVKIFVNMNEKQKYVKKLIVDLMEEKI